MKKMILLLTLIAVFLLGCAPTAEDPETSATGDPGQSTALPGVIRDDNADITVVFPAGCRYDDYHGSTRLAIYLLSGRTIGLTTVAAFLTVIGYSINDTVVIFDRIRENLKLHKGEKFGDLVNLSINQTLSRTLITSVSTFIVVFIMWCFGGPEISDFVFVMMWGIILGTYSSVFLSGPFVAWRAQRKAAKEKGC